MDRFFLEIQGSGQVRLPDSSQIRVGYADQNGRPYRAIGKDLVEQGASRFEAMAIPLYEETIKRAREYGVANEYTRKALERMNIYKPDQYPLLHDPAVKLQVEDRR